MNKATPLLIAGALLASTAIGLAQEAATAEAEVAKVVFDIDGATAGKWTMDLDAAKKLAAEKKLPILLDFSGSDWCHWCKVMEENVFTKPEWATYAKDNLVMVLLDFPNDESLIPEKYVARNEALQAEYGVKGFPTFIVLDDDGETELGRLGSGSDKTPASFQGELEVLFRNRSEAKAKYLASLSPEAQAEYKVLDGKIAVAKEDLKVAMEGQQVAMEGRQAAEKAMMEASQQVEKVAETIAAAEEGLRGFRAKQLGEEQYKEYTEAKAAFKAKEKELQDWLETQPERNEENMQKFQAMQGALQELGSKLEKY